MTDDSTRRPYDLFDDVRIPAGTSLLITVSDPVGSAVVDRLLGRGVDAGEHLLVVTTDDPATTIADRVRAASAADSTDRLHVIDCQSDPPGLDAVVSQNVDTPRNLTDIGIGFKDAFDGFEASGVERVRFGLLSLSVVLSYVDRETAYRFCQTLTRGLGQEGALGLFVLNADAHDQRTIGTLRRTFDGVIEVAGNVEGAPSARVSGLDGVPDDWISIE